MVNQTIQPQPMRRFDLDTNLFQDHQDSTFPVISSPPRLFLITGFPRIIRYTKSYKLDEFNQVELYLNNKYYQTWEDEVPYIWNDGTSAEPEDFERWLIESEYSPMNKHYELFDPPRGSDYELTVVDVEPELLYTYTLNERNEIVVINENKIPFYCYKELIPYQWEDGRSALCVEFSNWIIQCLNSPLNREYPITFSAHCMTDLGLPTPTLTTFR